MIPRAHTQPSRSEIPANRRKYKRRMHRCGRNRVATETPNPWGPAPRPPAFFALRQQHRIIDDWTVNRSTEPTLSLDHSRTNRKKAESSRSRDARTGRREGASGPLLNRRQHNGLPRLSCCWRNAQNAGVSGAEPLLFYTSRNDLGRPSGLHIMDSPARLGICLSLWGLPAGMLCREGGLPSSPARVGRTFVDNVKAAAPHSIACKPLCSESLLEACKAVNATPRMQAAIRRAGKPR